MKIKFFFQNSILILFLLAVTIKSTTANASLDSVGLSVVAIEDSNAFIVEITGIYFRKIDLTIKDLSGEVLYNERISNRPTYRKKMMLDLPKGKYILTAADGKSVSTQTLVLKNGKIHLAEFEKPVFDQKGKLLYISTTISGPSNIEVAFIDARGVAFFTDELAAVNKFEKHYNISSLPKGHYTVRLSADDQTYYNDLVIK